MGAAVTRTLLQKEANDFDADLYRLMDHAERRSEDRRLSPSQRALWRRIAVGLSAARPDVRCMMHPTDVGNTL